MRLPMKDIPSTRAGSIIIPMEEIVRMIQASAIFYSDVAEKAREISAIEWSAEHFTNLAEYSRALAEIIGHSTRVKPVIETLDGAYPVKFVDALEIEFDDEHTCPRCKGGIPNDARRGEYMGALSRRDNETIICSACGDAEAMDDFEKTNRMIVGAYGKEAR